MSALLLYVNWCAVRCEALLRGVLATCVAAAFLSCFPTASIAQIAPGVQQSAEKTANVSGTVLDVNAKPVAGAEVKLVGPAVLSTRSDVQGAFFFVSVPYGSYQITVTSSSLGAASRSIELTGDIAIAIQYSSASAGGLKTIGRVSTRRAGVSINVTPASIASVNPTRYALQGNASWVGMLSTIPGVAVSGGLAGGDTVITALPGSPFQPAIIAINGTFPYETSTTLDGMLLSNYTLGTSPGAGVNLSALPMPLFETADVVRGPGANAPSIVDSVGGSLVLHPPGIVNKSGLEASFSNDAYSGYFSNTKATFKVGKLSGTAVYGFNNSPGPYGTGPVFGVIRVSTVNGLPISASSQPQYLPDPIIGNCFCVIGTSLLANGALQSTTWSAHNGGIGLAYQLSPAVTAQAFYAGSQDTEVEGPFLDTNVFTPGSGYSGPLAPGSYVGASLSGVTPILQSGSLWEEKTTAYFGAGVLRLAALQNYTNEHQQNYSLPPPTQAQLWGTGAYCNNPACTATTPFTFNGQTATLVFPAAHFTDDGRSTNSDLLASYDTELGSNAYTGVSFVRSRNSVTHSFNFVFGTRSFPQFTPIVTQTIDEYRIRAGARFSDRLSLDASYYIAHASYHVPNPADPTGNTWVDSPFSYSGPRLGVTWRANNNTVLRASAGGGFALPPLLFLVGTNGKSQCSIVSCFVRLTNTSLKPETSFGYDFGTDVRVDGNTALSLDLYRANLYGQLFQSSNLVGTDPQAGLPLYVQQFQNLARSRFEGINLSVRRDVVEGVYWNAALGLSRGYAISLPAGFYNQGTQTCNFATGAGCQNTDLIVGQNFNGSLGVGVTGKYESTVPYANGNATFGYRWADKRYLDVQANYQGNNNVYFQPAFVEFDAHGAIQLTKQFAIMATFRNITGIYSQNLQVYTVNHNLVVPTIAGTQFPLYPIPYGPRSLILTTNFQL